MLASVSKPMLYNMDEAFRLLKRCFAIMRQFFSIVLLLRLLNKCLRIVRSKTFHCFMFVSDCNLQTVVHAYVEKTVSMQEKCGIFLTIHFFGSFRCSKLWGINNRELERKAAIGLQCKSKLRPNLLELWPVTSSLTIQAFKFTSRCGELDLEPF